MVDAEWVETEVRKVYPDADIAATDLTGNGDHWFVKVVDPSFEGMRPCLASDQSSRTSSSSSNQISFTRST